MDPLQRMQGILGLPLLELDARQAEGSLVLHGLIHIGLEDCPDRTPGTQVHPVAELEVADREICLPDVILE